MFLPFSGYAERAHVPSFALNLPILQITADYGLNFHDFQLGLGTIQRSIPRYTGWTVRMGSVAIISAAGMPERTFRTRALAVFV